MSKINGKANILGAVVTLEESGESTSGNGTAKIYYSSYVMNNLSDYCQNVKKKVAELSWKELAR